LKNSIYSIFQKGEQRSYLTAASAYFLLSAVFSRLPLLNYLGYEFSAAIALTVPVINGLLATGILRRRFADNTVPEAGEFRGSIRDSALQGISLLVIPLAIASLNIIFVRNCSYGEGVLYFLLIPVITSIWSSALAAFCFVMFRHCRAMYFLLTAIVLFHPLILGYAQPQIYSYNFIFGFFPGISYDEVLSITGELLIFRFVTLIAALFMALVSLFMVRLVPLGTPFFRKLHAFALLLRPAGLNVAVILLAVLLAGSWFFRVRLGFESPREMIQKSLAARYQTEHFNIYYADSSFQADEIKWVAAMHEFRFHQVAAALQVNYPGKITSYIYPDDDVKRRLIGTATTNIAKPWLGEIHLGRDSWQGTLKHELVHVVAGEFGMPVIRANFNIGIVEGLATAVDGDFGNRTLDEYSRSLIKFGLLREPAQLIKPIGFALKFSSVSYVAMGSFCGFLLHRYGIIRFKDLYGGRPARLVYGKSYESLIEEWQHYLDRIEVPESWQSHVRFYFNRPSIFAKECARAVAKMNEEAYRDLKMNDSHAALTEFSEALSTSWNTESYAGLVQSAYSAAMYDSVIGLVNARPRDLVNLFLIYGDALWKKGRDAEAQKAFNDILDLDISDRYDEAASLRLAALRDSVLKSVAVDYFTAARTDSAALSFLDSLRSVSKSPWITYLKGKVFIRQKKYETAVSVLESLGEKFETPVFNSVREQMIGQAYFFMHNFQSARLHFWMSLNYVTNRASVRHIEDWLDRCEWFEKSGYRYLK